MGRPGVVRKGGGFPMSAIREGEPTAGGGRGIQGI